MSLAAISIDLSEMCDADPPAMPNVTTADVLALNTGWADPIAFAAAAAKVYDLLKIYLWPQVCECVGAATPAAPAPPAPPANLPQVNPPGAVGTSGTLPCFQGTFIGRGNDSGNNSIVNIGGSVLPNLGTVAIPITPGQNYDPSIAWLLPTPLPDIIVVTLAVDGVVNVDAASIDFNGFTAAGGQAGSLGVGPYVQAGQTRTVTWNTATLPNARYANIDLFMPPGNGKATVSVKMYCNGQNTGGVAAPCCPPDPTLAGILQQILGLVTVTQRQIAPFAYVKGPAHVGLVGSGQLQVASPIIGVQVDLTVVPNYLGDIAGTPDRLFDAGFVAIGDGDGWWFNRRLGTRRTVWFPEAAGASTLIGYTLQPNVVATITELVREA
jgi:hypothetical protein